ncbi:hypothetical protein ACFL52_04585 [Candidatus Margulisiibacteriota bacterium]
MKKISLKIISIGLNIIIIFVVFFVINHNNSALAFSGPWYIPTGDNAFSNILSAIFGKSSKKKKINQSRPVDGNREDVAGNLTSSETHESYSDILKSKSYKKYIDQENKQ